MKGNVSERTSALRGYALSTLTIAVVLIAWEAVARAKWVPDLFLPSVTAVLLALRDGIADRSLPIDLGVSPVPRLCRAAASEHRGCRSWNWDGAKRAHAVVLGSVHRTRVPSAQD